MRGSLILASFVAFLIIINIIAGIGDVFGLLYTELKLDATSMYSKNHQGGGQAVGCSLTPEQRMIAVQS